MKSLANQTATQSLCGGALCVGQGGGRAADGGHEAKRFATQASNVKGLATQTLSEVLDV